jgi:hypothetical protein
MRETNSLWPPFIRLLIQHAGPKLSGYPTSTATRAMAIQNPAEGLLLTLTRRVRFCAKALRRHGANYRLPGFGKSPGKYST